MRLWLLLPPRFSSKGPRYDAVLDDGERVVENSLTPLLDAARVLHARGYTGRLELWDRTRRSPRMAVDITAAAGLTVEETRTTGPRFRRWRPFPGVRGRPISADPLPKAAQCAEDQPAAGGR